MYILATEFDHVPVTGFSQRSGTVLTGGVEALQFDSMSDLLKFLREQVQIAADSQSNLVVRKAVSDPKYENVA